jgi:hypothetical protein
MIKLSVNNTKVRTLTTLKVIFFLHLYNVFINKKNNFFLCITVILIVYVLY